MSLSSLVKKHFKSHIANPCVHELSVHCVKRRLEEMLQDSAVFLLQWGSGDGTPVSFVRKPLDWLSPLQRSKKCFMKTGCAPRWNTALQDTRNATMNKMWALPGYCTICFLLSFKDEVNIECKDPRRRVHFFSWKHHGRCLFKKKKKRNLLLLCGVLCTSWK